MVVGQEVSLALLLQLETGKKLVPDVAQKRQRLWHPDDLITPLPGTDTPWREALWKDAQDWLGEDGLQMLAGGKADEAQSVRVAPAANRVIAS